MDHLFHIVVYDTIVPYSILGYHRCSHADDAAGNEKLNFHTDHRMDALTQNL